MCDSAETLHELLTEHFKFAHIVWSFTGGRGVHCRVMDEEAFVFTAQQRNTALDYILTKMHERGIDDMLD